MRAVYGVRNEVLCTVYCCDVTVKSAHHQHHAVRLGLNVRSGRRQRQRSMHQLWLHPSMQVLKRVVGCGNAQCEFGGGCLEGGLVEVSVECGDELLAVRGEQLDDAAELLATPCFRPGGIRLIVGAQPLYRTGGISCRVS